LNLFAYIVRGLQVYPERMKENMEASYGLVFSQRVMLALIDKGMTRQDAYKVVQANAMKSWEARTPYLDFLLDDEHIRSKLSRDELASLFDYGWYLRHVDASFERIGL
ncbi:MAG: adenylosuccinate lyase, partial [Chloroflexi bacterium]|nr:adenylosuccinate lyase [Chloroflexota bacterium]